MLSVLILWFWTGCAAPDQEIDLVSFNSAVDQRVIAHYYQQEAFRHRQQADELDARADLYARMFGPDSDWVSGTRLLAQSYRLTADDRERLATEHLDARRNVRSSASALRPQASSERTP